MLPLAGIKVIELGANLAGPYAAEVLGHLGADVVKVERPEGDDARHWGPPFKNGVSPSFLAVNANKRSITVDLKDLRAVADLAELIGEADVLVQNHRPGTLEALGLGADTLTRRYPRLIYCSVWGFGNAGPLSRHPAYEPIVQAFAGLMVMNAAEGDPPTRLGVSALDYGTGMWTAIGALAGLIQRAQTGRGCVVDASLLETGLAWLKGPIAAFGVTATVPERHRTGSGRLIPFQAFETKTGPIIVAAGNDRLFVKLAGVLGRPEWATDPRFANNAGRFAHKAELLQAIEEIFVTRSKGEWIDLLEAAGIPCAPINSLPDVLAQPQTAALDILKPMPGDDLPLVTLPLSFDGVRPPLRRPPPRIGEHNDDVLGRKARPS
ncbi:MAG TPA: CoA transferase [Methylomirabilota bacterium]|jgi:crotonobetainyl-CoA:carnitine CoA-transferase CaiB-like acyl-CoA transferase